MLRLKLEALAQTFGGPAPAVLVNLKGRVRGQWLRTEPWAHHRVRDAYEKAIKRRVGDGQGVPRGM